MRLTFFVLPGLLILGCNGGETTTTSGDASTSTGTTTAEPTSSSTAPTSSSSTSTGDEGTAGATEGSGTTSTGSSTEVSTEVSTGSSTEVSAGTTGTTGGETTGGETTGTTGGDTSTGDASSGETDGQTSGGVMGCGFDGPTVDATLVHLDKPAPPCGTLQFEGTLTGPAIGPTYALDACPCGANCLLPDPWSFAIDVPEMMLPQPMPQCPRIVVQRQMSKMGCELVGAAVFDTKGWNPEVPVWAAGGRVEPIDAIKAQITVTSKVVEECECDNCCNTPQRFDLTFTALEDSVTLPEDGLGNIGGNEVSYGIRNFQSHATGICDASPSIDWVMRLQFAP